MNEITVSEIFSKSKADLKGKWGTAIGFVIVYLIIYGGLGLIPYAGKVSFLLGGPFAIALAIFFLNLVDYKELSINQLFDGFKFHFLRSCIAYFLMIIFIALLLLLLIVPGVIAMFAYSQTFYIMAEDPEIQPMDALKKSKEMMNGHKMELFLMSLAILGLLILGILTLCIAWFWIIPFAYTCNANFYRKLAGEKEIDLDYKGQLA
ncbi:MAG TPA: DUF975 family protein [Ferruginibacter sp.]|jgi:uncharacterized membrane protein|nr:DUF975 family protein [Ferruginibacter sp.]